MIRVVIKSPENYKYFNYVQDVSSLSEKEDFSDYAGLEISYFNSVGRYVTARYGKQYVVSSVQWIDEDSFDDND